MGSFKDRTGEVHGRLTFLSYVGPSKHKKSLWLCSCSCGNQKVIPSNDIVTGRIVSCGCYLLERIVESNVTHGLSNRTSGKNNLYNVWKAIRQRCNNPNNKDFKYYGGAGISLCAEWNDFSEFSNWAIVNGYKEGLTIERKNTKLGYNPANCSWASMMIQCRNKRNNVKIFHNGVLKCLVDWAKEYAIDPTYLGQRLKRMTFLQAISTPIIRRRNYKFKSKTIQLCLPGI